MRIFIFLFCFILGVFISHTSISSPSGNELLRSCGAAIKQQDGIKISPKESLEALWCIGYLAGFLDAVGLSPPKFDGKQIICPPKEGISTEQLIRVVTKWLHEHPEHLHESGRMEALLAISRAFPCK